MSELLTVSTSLDSAGATPVIVLAGELDISTAPKLVEAVRAVMLAEPARILIDLEAVEFIDAAGIGALAAAVESAQADHEELRLRRPSPAVRRVLDILHLDGSLPLEETLAGN